MGLQDQIDYLNGKLMVTETILSVLISSYPDHQKMAKALTLATEVLIGKSIQTTLSEQVLAGQRATIEKMRAMLGEKAS